MLTKNYLAIYAKSFNWAGFFLPKKTYDKCSALYDFCRIVDNIADDENKIEVKKNNFIKFRNNFVNKNYDEGKIIFQRKLKINYPCTSHVLAKKIHELEMKFFPIVIEDLIKTIHYE